MALILHWSGRRCAVRIFAHFLVGQRHRMKFFGEKVEFCVAFCLLHCIIKYGASELHIVGDGTAADCCGESYVVAG